MSSSVVYNEFFSCFVIDSIIENDVNIIFMLCVCVFSCISSLNSQTDEDQSTRLRCASTEYIVMSI